MKPAKHAPNQDSTRDGVGAATQPIPVSELVAALDQLKDENYVLHPSLMHSDAERAELDQSRYIASLISLLTSTHFHSFIDTPVSLNNLVSCLFVVLHLTRM